MKTIIATLLASLSLASATTITINQDAPGTLDFTVEWGPWWWGFPDSGARETGPGGSTVSWQGHSNRNPYYFLMEIHQPDKPAFVFGVSFWRDPEYSFPVPTAFGSPNIVYSWLSAGEPAAILPLGVDPYGARFVFGDPNAVPDGGETGWYLLTAGLAGVCFYGRKIHH